MPIPPSAFWNKRYIKNPPLKEADIAKAEAHFGCTLPTEFLDLLRVQNGVFTNDLAFPVTGMSWSEDHVLFERLNGIAFGDEAAYTIMETDYMTKEWGLPPKQVLLGGDGHTWFSLDYRQGPVPCLSWLDADSESSRVLASSFAEFYEALVPAAQFDPDA